MDIGGIGSFTRAMRELARVAPTELDDALLRVGRTEILPASRARAAAAFSGAPPHDGTAARLANQTRVIEAPRGIAIVNDKVYANVQNWGGHTWHSRTRVGRSNKPPGAGVPATHFIDQSARENPAFEAAMQRELERLVDRFLS